MKEEQRERFLQNIPDAGSEETGAPRAALHTDPAPAVFDGREIPPQEGYLPPQGNPADAAAAGGMAARAPADAGPAAAGDPGTGSPAAERKVREGKKRELRRRRLIAAAILLGAALLLLAVSLLTPVGPMLGVPAILLALVGLILLLCVGIGWLSERMSVWPIVALLLDFACVPLLFAGGALSLTGVLFFIGFPLLLAGLVSPVAGIVVGIAALCGGVKRNGRAGTALSVVAILLPVIAVTVLILLLSTGVIRISLM